jgi:hypothetical protein
LARPFRAAFSTIAASPFPRLEEIDMTAVRIVALAVSLVLAGSASVGAQAPIEIATEATELVVQDTGGTDEALDNTYEAFRFTLSSAAQIGSVKIWLKADEEITAGAVRAFIYSDNGGSPGTSLIVPGQVTGYPTSVYVSPQGIVDTYKEFEFRLPMPETSSAGNYWVVLKIESVTGTGNIYLDRRSVGADLYAEGSSSFATQDNREPVYTILSAAEIAISGTNPNGFGVFGTTTSGWAGFFKSDGSGGGVKGESISGFGVGGNSFDFIGVRGSSTNGIGVAGESVNSVGGQFITTSALMPGSQHVSKSGPAVQLLPELGPFSMALSLDPKAGKAGWIDAWSGEDITLDGDGSTDSQEFLIPEGSIIEAVVWRVTNQIVGAASHFAIGTTQTNGEFAFLSPTAALAQGSSGYGFNMYQNGFHVHTTSTKIRVTTNGTTSAGSVRVVVFYKKFFAPTE